MQQVIMDGKRVVCVTKEPYPQDIIKSMKKAGYKVKEVEEYESEDISN